MDFKNISEYYDLMLKCYNALNRVDRKLNRHVS